MVSDPILESTSSDPVSDPITEAQRPVIAAMAQAFSLYGWPEVMGRIYGLLVMHNAPLTQDQLCSHLGVSKATVSTNLRNLETLHFVHRVGTSNSASSGGRPRIFYEAEKDFMKVMQELLHQNVRREVELMDHGLADSKQRLLVLSQTSNEAVAQKARENLQTLERFENYLRMGRRILWLVQSVERMQHYLSSLWRPEE
jgi:DNA-binding transcriptional regulator GbsR (MarR family)